MSARDVPIQLLNRADSQRRIVAPHTAPQHKSAFGQFMTPTPVARFMASLFPSSNLRTGVLLDAGAGLGALSCAFLDRWANDDSFAFTEVELEAYEIDPKLREHLSSTLAAYGEHLSLRWRISPNDFIEDAALESMSPRRFTHAILNPPYKKIHSLSNHRLFLRKVGIETVNLYSAFVALGLSRMKIGGQIVAIIPRSFCNGPYYRPFREFLLWHAAVHHIHLFASRNKAFQDDGVLQENVILRIERGGVQGPVVVSHSTDDSFSDLVEHEYPFDRIVFPSDPERFVHVPLSPGPNSIEMSHSIHSTLANLAISVSTGPVVDFRFKDHIEEEPIAGTVPLLYPGHFVEQTIHWPKPGQKRGNVLRLNEKTKKWLYPNAFYTVVRRFSSKEEPRRIVASVVRPDAFPDTEFLAFENHLNVFHRDKAGLPEALAYGLALYLNSTAVDQNFRRFNGHTQVNATDLRTMKYPDGRILSRLGEWALNNPSPSQASIDKATTTLTG